MNNTKNLFNMCQYDFQQVISYFDGNTKLIYISLVNQIHVDLNDIPRLKMLCGFFGSEKFLKYIVPTLDGSQDELLKCYDEIIKCAIHCGNLGLIRIIIQKMCECLNVSVSEINSKKCCHTVPHDCTFSLRYLHDYVWTSCVGEQYHILEYLLPFGVHKASLRESIETLLTCKRMNTIPKIVKILNDPDYCNSCGGYKCHYQNHCKKLTRKFEL